MNRIYLDYAASAPLAPEAKAAIESFINGTHMREKSLAALEMTGGVVGNPSSLHQEGRAMQAMLDKAHTTVAAVFGVQPTEVIFTSGATESNNLIIKGVLAAWRQQNPGKTPHVIMSALEHPSWRAAAKAEEAEVTLIPVSEDGVVSAQAVIEAIKDNTALVGCMYVNNEIGTIQPVAEIGKAIEELRGTSKFPVFHVDAVQAFPYLNTHSGHIHADSITLSGHKYGAVAGIGVLILKKSTPFLSTTKGGSQEWGSRAGTENVIGAVTLAAVVEHLDSHREDLTNHAKSLQEALERRLGQEFPNIRILSQSAPRAPHITYMWLPGVTDEHIVHKLDLAGIAVSSGSACSSGAMLPSATLMAMGFTDKEAFGGIRISYGRFTTLEEIETFVTKLKEVI